MIRQFALPLMAVMIMAAGPKADPTRSLYLQLIEQARGDGRPRAAIAYLDDFDRRYPGEVQAQILRVNSLLDLNDVDAAERAAAVLPASPESSAVRGHVLCARGQWAEAATLYRQAMDARPADALLRNALGYALLRLGQTAPAIEALRGAVDLAPTDRSIRNNLLLALIVGGERAEADARLRQIRDGGEQDALRRMLAVEADRIARKES
ncbi:tetratricopeptide repeat protein [Sphingobium vermicomposti]|uniref:Flp pilus assembly protein TadD n=1 Tax=Sphingobium vermicomposti TaxID=529005 RepID=A0A846M8B2_9SPHN|nr:tetratricopeptide repeat protein [Sphingobium vermicomposti]NIJ18112.1 Flp pilus assembly protein TadD [Sphingobium vermicomposti]